MCSSTLLISHKIKATFSGGLIIVEMLSESWNSLKEYVDTWYPVIKSLEQKRLEAKRYAPEYEIALIPSRRA
jgi:alpha-glucuronidase